MHAPKSPSASPTWMTCSGSFHLAPDPGSDKGSAYSARGSSTHTVSYKSLITDCDPSVFVGQVVDGVQVDQEMSDIATTYVEFVRSLPGLKRYEVRVSVEEVIQGCYGTADVVAMRHKHLTVGDLKSGAGVRVDAERNTQLLIYALGAFLQFDPLYDFETITLVIVQPPLENISTWTIDRQQLLAFADELREADRRILEEPNTFTLSEKGCRWCKSKASCPEQRRLAAEAAAIDFKDPSIDLPRYLEMVDHLRSFADAVENAAKETILQGGAVSGWKVVEGRRTRSWKDEAAVETALLGQGVRDIYTKPKLLSVAQLEKVMKKSGTALELEPFIEMKAGSPTLAKESDARKATNRALDAAKDFAA
jgi:hypothetical protein